MRKKLFAIFMTLAMVMALSLSFSFAAYAEDEHLYLVDQNKNIYQDGDTLEIPLGYAAFVYFDNTYKKIDGKKVNQDVQGWDPDPLADAGIILAAEDYKTVGFKAFDLGKGKWGLRLDTAYSPDAAVGTEIEMEYWLTEDKKDFDFEPIKTQTIKIKITEPASEPQPKVTKADTLMTVKTSAKTVKASKLKKSAQTVKPLKVRIDASDIYPCEAEVSYAKTGGSPKLSVNKTNGKVTIKKGTKKGTYNATIKISTDSGHSKIFKDKTKTVSVKVVVK